VIDAASHEHEEVADPVGNAKAQGLFVERGDGGGIGMVEGDVAELERPRAGAGRLDVEKAPIREQLDDGALGIGEGDQARHPGQRIAAGLRLHPEIAEATGEIVCPEIARNLERQPGAALARALFENDGELSQRRGKTGAIGFAARQHEADDLLVVFDLPVDVGRLEGGVADPLDFDHGCSCRAIS